MEYIFSIIIYLFWSHAPISKPAIQAEDYGNKIVCRNGKRINVFFGYLKKPENDAYTNYINKEDYIIQTLNGAFYFRADYCKYEPRLKK